MNKIEVKIKGMHCPSCEILIERQLKKIKGVEKVSASHTEGKAIIHYSKKPGNEEIENAIKEHGYSVAEEEKPQYFEVFMFFVIVLGVYYTLKLLNLVPSIGLSENMSYGFVFLIGLVAAISTCLAVSGGLLLAVMAKHAEMHENLSKWHKFKPNIYFNIGRIISYTVLGALIGAFGSALTLSSKFSGFLTIFASLVMIILGFQLLRIFPWLGKIQPRMPKIFGHKMHDASKEHGTAPFLLGAGTFFLPCGFTIALQLYVLANGSAITGALTMLVFSLGTLPSLISLGAITSCIKDSIRKDFMKFAGVIVILLGLFNMTNGLSLAGFHMDLNLFNNRVLYDNGLDIDTSSINPSIANYIKSSRAPAQKLEVINGKQVAKMSIVDLRYLPSKFIATQGIPVEWQIDASQAAGCAQVITSPDIGIFKFLSPSKINIITFTPNKAGTFYFSCTMGMTTPRSSFQVVPG